jgi:hypothetical protein
MEKKNELGSVVSLKTLIKLLGLGKPEKKRCKRKYDYKKVKARRKMAKESRRANRGKQ